MDFPQAGQLCLASAAAFALTALGAGVVVGAALGSADGPCNEVPHILQKFMPAGLVLAQETQIT